MAVRRIGRLRDRATSRRTAGQAFALHEKLVAPRVSLARMDGGSRVDDGDRYFSRAGRRRGGRGVLE